MPICEGCKKEVLVNYQTIETKRGTVLHWCNECLKPLQRKEADNADHSKKPI